MTSKRLKTDYLDIYQIHWPNPAVDPEETFGAFEELKGKMGNNADLWENGKNQSGTEGRIF